MLADQIAKMIEEMLEEGGGELDLRRNEMAGRLGCVPSQISYVITSRFTPERGYIIESRRGGGGHIRIVRKQMHRNEYLMHFFYAVGDRVGEAEAQAFVQNLADNDVVTAREAALITSALSDAALTGLSPDDKCVLRAQIFRHILLTLMQ